MYYVCVQQRHAAAARAPLSASRPAPAACGGLSAASRAQCRAAGSPDGGDRLGTGAGTGRGSAKGASAAARLRTGNLQEALEPIASAPLACCSWRWHPRRRLCLWAPTCLRRRACPASASSALMQRRRLPSARASSRQTRISTSLRWWVPHTAPRAGDGERQREHGLQPQLRAAALAAGAASCASPSALPPLRCLGASLVAARVLGGGAAAQHPDWQLLHAALRGALVRGQV